MREPQQLYMFQKEATTEKRLLSDRVPGQLQGGQNKRHSQESPPTTTSMRFPVQLVRMLNPISTRCNIVLGVLKPTDTEA